MPAKPRIEQNRFLAALSPKERNQLLDGSKVMNLKIGDSLWEMQEGSRYVYFPSTCVISFISETADGDAIEVGMVGFEGPVGPLGSLGLCPPYRAMVRVAGEALRVEYAVFKDILDECQGLHELLFLYFTAFLTQISQSVVCNRFHNNNERLARWLLLTQDRVKSDTFDLTQDLIAQMLGTRRASVTVAVGLLHKAGTIEYKRGRVTIRDRAALESASCECYAVIRGCFDRLVDGSSGVAG